MRYFTYLADQAFKTSASGERLFIPGGLWSRPYIIPDAATEQRLHKKQVWMLRGMFAGVVVCQPFLFVLLIKFVFESYWLLIYLVLVMAVFWLVDRAVFARDLKSLQRAPDRLSLRYFCGQMAQRHDWAELALLFSISILFVAVGASMLGGGAYAPGILCVVLGGLCSVTWSYSLCLKVWGGESMVELSPLPKHLPDLTDKP